MMLALAFMVIVLVGATFGAVVWVGTADAVRRLLGRGRVSSAASLFFGVAFGLAAMLAVLFVAASVLPDPPFDPNGPRPLPPIPPAAGRR
jgi:hypothetical protein